MSLTNPKDVVTEERLKDFYDGIYPYLGGMPEMVANKFSRSDIYSTTEKMVGQWTDGKPIYQKTINVGALPNATTKNVATGVSNISRMLYYYGYGFGSTYSIVLPYPALMTAGGTLQNVKIYYDITNNRMVITTSQDYSGVIESYITILYTKTTDSAISIGVDTDYSTTEKIVGTDTDGKYIYQKTINFGALPNNSSKKVAHGISNINKIKNYFGMATNGNAALSLPDFNGSDYIRILFTSNNEIQITDNTDKSSWTAQVTVQYTKTS